MVSLSNHDLADESPSLSKLFLDLIKTLFKSVQKGDAIVFDEATALHNAKTYMNGVFEGFGGDFSTIAYNTPDYRKLANIERNVYQFSGAKNYHQLRELTSALVTGSSAEPRILPYKEFRTKALTILDEYQGRWLETEYETAVAGAQMASKWLRFDQNPKTLLQYRTMEDGRVREEHALLNRITRPLGDSFWKTWYPPNGFGCRCTVVELNEGKPTPDKNMEYPDIPKIFQTNLAQAGLVFPKDHPYFIGIPKDVKTQINNLIPDHPEP